MGPVSIHGIDDEVVIVGLFSCRCIRPGPTILLDEYFRAREVDLAKRALIARVTLVDARSDRLLFATSIRRFRRRIVARGAKDGVENLRDRSGT
jgi:hypothetical protein